MYSMKKSWRRCLLILALTLGLTAGLMPAVCEGAAYAEESYTTFSDYLVTDDDSLSSAAEKKILFNGMEWYVIEDSSAADGYVTLFAAESIGEMAFSENGDTKRYSESTVRQYLDSLTDEGGLFYDVAGYIETTEVSTVIWNSTDVDKVDARLYLLSADEFADTPWPALDCEADGAPAYWLRTPGYSSEGYNSNSVEAEVAPCVIKSKSYRSSYAPYLKKGLMSVEVNRTLLVRPALHLSTSKVKLSGNEVVPVDYTAFIPSGSDSKDELAAKQVKFNGYNWYIIDNYSEDGKEYVTLFAAEPFSDNGDESGVAFNSSDKNNSKYSESTIKDYLAGLTADGGTFSRVSDVIKTVSVKGSDSDAAIDAKLYLLSKDEVSALPQSVRKHNTDVKFGTYWLRSPGSSNGVGTIVTRNGDIWTSNLLLNLVYMENLVRPALVLDTGKVAFNDENYSFTLKGDVSNVRLNADSISIVPGDTAQLTAKVLPSGAKNKGITWSSDDEAIATVDSNGKVTAVALGETTVRAIADNGTTDYAGDDVTAECVVRVQNPVPADVNNMSVAYDGKAHGLSLSVSDETAENISVKYGLSEGTYDLDESPVITDVSESPKTVYYSISADGYVGKTGSATITIEKADPTIELAPKAINPSYTGEAQDLITEGRASGGDILYSLDNETYSEEIPQGTEKKAYTVYFKVVGDSNHNDWGPKTITSTIGEESASVVKAPSAKTLTYTGEVQALISAGTAENGEMYYSLDGVDFSTDIPAGTNAGSYTVYYAAKGTGDYTDSAVETVEVTIEPKTVTVTADNASKYYAEEDPEFSASVSGLLGSDTVKYSISRKAGEHAGTYAITPYGEDVQGNYKLVCKNGTFTINKATSNEVTVSISGWKEGETANAPSSKAAYGVAEYSYSPSEDGTFTAGVPADAGTWYVKASVSDTDDYPACEAVKSFEITSAKDTSHAYADYLAVGADADSLAAKKVKFNGSDWYIIQDNSGSATSGSVTLLSTTGIGSHYYKHAGYWANYYASDVRGYLDTLTEEGGSFAGVADAIKTITLDSDSSGQEVEAKLYLLSINDFRGIVQEGSALADIDNNWWLRNGQMLFGYAYFVNEDGALKYTRQITDLVVRPALQLDLTKVSYDKGTKTFTLNNNVSRITLDQRELELDVSGTIGSKSGKLSVSFEPSDVTSKNVTWSSSDTTVAAVDQNGNITAKKEGSAVITATATNGTSDTADDKTATCRVTVADYSDDNYGDVDSDDEKLQAAKADAIAALDAVDVNQYQEPEKTTVENAVASAKEALSKAASEAEVKTALDAALKTLSAQAVYKSSLPKAAVRRLAKAKKAVTVKWKKLSKKKRSMITGFQIQIASNKSFTKNATIVNVKGKTKVSKKIRELTAKKTYYVRIRTYKVKDGKIYAGKWSKIKKVRL